MRARALELVEYRLERLELKLEQMTKGMRMASRAFERFNSAVRELSMGDKMIDEQWGRCQNFDDDGNRCDQPGDWYDGDSEATGRVLCRDCAEGYGLLNDR